MPVDVAISLCRFALGSELVYQMSGGMQGAMVSVGGYYKADMWEASARIGLHSWNVNYYQKLDRNFLLLASLDGSLMQVRSRTHGHESLK